jgi:spermidine/putrescine transport system substrate-binding protein
MRGDAEGDREGDNGRRDLAPGLDRRGFLGRSARAVGGLVLAGPFATACRGSDAGSSRSARVGAPRTVRISNWPLYIDAETTADFESATGIHVAYTEDVNDNNEYFAKIAEPLARGQSIDRDIVVVTDWLVGRMIRLGYCTPLDDSRFPNKAGLVDDLRDVDFDPGRTYSVPWLSGMVGIGYNPGKTGRHLTSVSDLFDPALAGRVTMLTEMRDTLGLLMLGDGRDPARATPADVEAVCAKVEKYRENGHIRAFTGNDYAEDLAGGNIAAAIAWSGDIQGLAGDNPDLRWIAPREGAMLFSDNMVVPRTSDRLAAAMAWMNYVYQPAVSARIVRSVFYLSPVQGAVAELARTSPELAASPLINPPDDVRARLHIFRTLSDDEDQQYNRLFQQAMGA